MAVSNSQISNILKRLEGYTTSIHTPLTADGQLDVPALERLIERVIAGGAKGVLVVGWMGEGPLLPDSVCAEVLKETVRIVAGRILVMAGISEQSLPRVLGLGQVAKDAGADILLTAPAYSYHINSDQVHAYFRDFADRINMPVIVYHNTDITVQPDLPLMVRLSKTPGVIGVKASCDFNLVLQYFYLANRPGRFAVIPTSTYHFPATLLLGFRHFLLGTPGNLTPSLCSQMFCEAQAGNWEAVVKSFNRMMEFFNILWHQTSGGDFTIKFILSELGLCQPYLTAPLQQISADEQAIVRKAMKDYADILK